MANKRIGSIIFGSALMGMIIGAGTVLTYNYLDKNTSSEIKTHEGFVPVKHIRKIECDYSEKGECKPYIPIEDYLNNSDGYIKCYLKQNYPAQPTLDCGGNNELRHATYLKNRCLDC